MANTLFLRLEGPMQSWGERARWSERDTAPEPTKSGVVGLLACSLGWGSDGDLRRLSDAIRLGVRVDCPGEVLVDYHTVTGGVMSAEGKIKVNAATHEPETVVSKRAYLCGASFLAAVQAVEPGVEGEVWITRLTEAVQKPVWPFYLGRKSCPPSTVVFAGVGSFESLEDALRPAHGRARVVIEVPPGQGVRRRDAVDSRSRRTFLPRYTREMVLAAVPDGKEGGP